jgi:hypothetical protein
VSGSNGNGNGHGNPVANLVFMPGKNGGKLKRGNTVNVGRTRKVVRDMLVAEFAAQMPLLKGEVTRGKLSRKEYADLCAKYGLGTTITETDTEGNDVPRPVFYLPENGRLGR